MDNDQNQNTSNEEKPKIEMLASRNLASWMFENRLSYAFTTYLTGKVFFIGLSPEGRLSIFERTFTRCMGLCADEGVQTLYMSSLYQLWRFKNSLLPGQTHEGYDALYVPQVGYTTGDLDIHDIAIDKNGRPIFVNTLFSCLATTDDTHNFIPLWKPKFISKLASEDRCHLNGLAMENGEAGYVTAVSQSDIHDGWRAHRTDGGILIDVRSNEIVAEGLSMPHSPRLYRNKLWLLNAGTGHFGYVDLKSGKFEEIIFCPGYLRGMSFFGDFAVITLSQRRDDVTFKDLPLDKNLKKHSAEDRCALYFIDINKGDVIHSLMIEGIITELYDVIFLPNLIRPMALGFKTTEIEHIISVGGDGQLF